MLQQQNGKVLKLAFGSDTTTLSFFHFLSRTIGDLEADKVKTRKPPELLPTQPLSIQFQTHQASL